MRVNALSAVNTHDRGASWSMADNGRLYLALFDTILFWTYTSHLRKVLLKDDDGKECSL